MKKYLFYWCILGGGVTTGFSQATNEIVYNFDDIYNQDVANRKPVRVYDPQKQGQIKGTPWRFPHFQEAKITTKSGQVFNVFANLNLISNDLMVQDRTKQNVDTTQCIIVNKSKIVSVAFTGAQESFSIVDKVLGTWGEVIFQKDTTLNVYKIHRKMFKKADFHDDGIAKRGQLYDEYSDRVVYLIKTKKETIELKEWSKKRLSKVFPEQTAYIKTFFEKNKVKKLDKTLIVEFLKDLNL